MKVKGEGGGKGEGKDEGKGKVEILTKDGWLFVRADVMEGLVEQ